MTFGACQIVEEGPFGPFFYAGVPRLGALVSQARSKLAANQILK